MRKGLALFLTLILMISVLAGCGQTGEESSGGTDGAAGEPVSGTAAIESLATIGDAMALEGAEFRQSSGQDNRFTYVFGLEGTYYRVMAPMTDEEFQAFMDLEFDDPDYDAKLEKVIGPLKIDMWENLNDMIPPQEELDQWVGKTGQELFDAGWTNSGWNLDDMEFWMDYGPFMYTVVMDGTVENVEDFDEEDIAPLVVKSVTYNDLGDASYIEEKAE